MSQRSIAIVGASADRSKFGNKAVRAYLRQGYAVYPVHPRADTIEGLPAYRSVLDVPVERLDMVSIYLPPELGMAVLDEVARKPPAELWLNPGAESPELLDKAKKLGLNVVAACSIVAVGIHPENLDG
jgi:predicted CoA-binding protein